MVNCNVTVIKNNIKGSKNIVRLGRNPDRIEIEVDENGNQGNLRKNRAASGETPLLRTIGTAQPVESNRLTKIIPHPPTESKKKVVKKAASILRECDAPAKAFSQKTDSAETIRRIHDERHTPSH